jgi:hypothetical protein
VSFLDQQLTAFTSLQTSFMQPATGQAVIVNVESSNWMPLDLAIYVQGGGSYEIARILDVNRVQLINTGASGNATAGTVVPAGGRVIAFGSGGGGGLVVAGTPVTGQVPTFTGTHTQWEDPSNTPLSNVFYLDPTYTGSAANGSESAPYTSIGDIIPFGMMTTATIYLTPGTSISDSIYTNFGTGKVITFECLGGQASLVSNMTWRGGVGSELHFRNVDVGNIQINNTGSGTDAILIEARSSTISTIQHNDIGVSRTCNIVLYGTHLAPTRLSSASDSSVSGVITTNGNIYGERTLFAGNTTCVSSFLNNSYLVDGTTHTFSDNSVFEGGCEFGAGVTIHFSASSKTLYMDAHSYKNFLGSGVTLTGTGATISLLWAGHASDVTNDSSVSGTTVKDALNNLHTSSGVASFNSRTGAVSPASGDYTSTQITNSSSVSGTGVTGALNTLNTTVSGLVTGVSSVFGRTGAVTATSGDYAASKINNDSSTVTGTHVSDALDALKTSITGATLTADETSAHIASQVISVKDGGITNAKVATAAAIAGTKISPDFGSQNVVTTGYIQAPQIGDGTSNIEVHATSFRTTCIGNFIGLGQSFAGLNNGDSTASGSLPSLTISASSGSGSATHTAGLLTLSGGPTSSPNGTGGDVFLCGGSGPSNTKNGNIALNLFPVSWQAMEHGVYIAEASAIPTGNPSSGFFLYVDPADHKLKVRGSSGTVTTLANP